jgi:glycosyltransferase involved in cell wall biosynthesis
VALAGQADKVRLIHWGVDCRLFRPDGVGLSLRASLGVSADTTIVLCPRALAPVYDIETVLKALAMVAQTEPDVVLLLLEFNARPDYREQIDGWITQWGLRERVRFLPRVETQRDMADLYRLATVVLSLPLSDSLSLTVLESLACGTPVVVSDLPAYHDWVVDGDVGYRVPVQDSAAAADAVLRLVRAGERARLAMGAQGRARVVSRASLDQQMQAATDLYEMLLSEPGG